MTAPPPPAAPPAPRTGRRRVVRWAARGLAVVLVLFTLLNVLAYRHAHAFTHYSRSAVPPTPPEAMTVGEKLAAVLGGVPVPRPVNAATPESVGLAYATEILTVDDDPVLVWHVDRPAASGVVVLGPGYGAAKASLLPEAAAFHRLGWATVLVDYRGAGESSGSTTTFGVREGADFAAAVTAARLRHPHRPVVAYGFSMGAAAAVAAVRRHLPQTPDGVVLEAPFDTMLGAVRARFRATGLPAWPGADLLVFWGGYQLGFDGFDHRPADDAASVRCPARVLHGSADPRAPPEMAIRVYDHLAGPKERVTFDGAGHGSLLRGDPAKWTAAMTAFLAEVEATHRAEQERIANLPEVRAAQEKYSK